MLIIQSLFERIDATGQMSRYPVDGRCTEILDRLDCVSSSNGQSKRQAVLRQSKEPFEYAAGTQRTVTGKAEHKIDGIKGKKQIFYFGRASFLDE